jgi:hypothetical protein
MTGDDRVRRCGQCRKNVYNLTALTAAEAAAVVFKHNGKLCLRYYQRHDGTILLADCTVGVSRGNRHRWVAAGAASLVVGGLGAAATGYELREPDMLPPPHVSVAITPPDPLLAPPAVKPTLTQPPTLHRPPVHIEGWHTGVPPLPRQDDGND